MRGLPNIVATKTDICNCLDLVAKGDVSKGDLKNKLQEMQSDCRVWVFNSDVVESYMPTTNEKIVENTTVDGVTVWSLYTQVDNVDARIIKMGYTKAEFDKIIESL